MTFGIVFPAPREVDRGLYSVFILLFWPKVSVPSRGRYTQEYIEVSNPKGSTFPSPLEVDRYLYHGQFY